MRNMLLSALGLKDFKADKEIRVLDVYHGDRFLLASDGLTNTVEEQQMMEIVSRNEDPQQAVEELTQEAIANGAGDDVTCLAFYVQSVIVENPPTELTWWQKIKSVLLSSE